MRFPVKQFNTSCQATGKLRWMGATKPTALELRNKGEPSEAALTNLTFGHELLYLAKIAYLAVIKEDKQLDT